MAKLTMSNLMDVIKRINNGDLKSDDVYVIDPNRIINSYGGHFIAAHSLSDAKIGDLWQDGNDLVYLIRTEKDDNDDITNKAEDDEDEFI